MLQIPMSIVWLVVTIVLVISEAATMGLTAIWFAFGALFSMVAALIGLNIWIQLLLFIIGSGLLLYFTRPIAKKYLTLGKEKTNADRVVSMRGVVTLAIDNEAAVGQVRINGQIWTARSASDERIEEGAEIVVKSISGVKVIVERV